MSSSTRNPLAALSLLLLLVVAGLVLRKVLTSDEPRGEGAENTASPEPSSGKGSLHAPRLVRDDLELVLPLVPSKDGVKRYRLPVRFDEVRLAFGAAGEVVADQAYEIAVRRVTGRGRATFRGILQHHHLEPSRWRATLDVEKYGLNSAATDGRLELDVRLYPGQYLGQLQQEMVEERSEEWNERLVDRFILEIVRDQTPPFLEPSYAPGTPIGLEWAAGSSHEFAFQVQDEFLAEVEVAGRAIDLATSSSSFIDREERRLTVVSTEWPRGDDGRGLAEIEVRVVDLAGFETRRTLTYESSRLAPPPEPLPSPGAEEGPTEAPSLRLLDWELEADRTWVDPGYEFPTWETIRVHRRVTVQQLAVLHVAVEGLTGEGMIVLEADAERPPHEPNIPNARYRAPYELRRVVTGPRTTIAATFPLIPLDPALLHARPLHVRVSLWKPDPERMARAEDGKVRGALFAREHVQIFRDDREPLVEPYLAAGQPVRFPSEGLPVLEFELFEHFPLFLTVAGQPISWFEAADPIDPDLVHVAPRSRSFRIEWPTDENGRPRREIPVVAQDRLGRRVETTWSYPEREGTFTLPAAHPLQLDSESRDLPAVRFLPAAGTPVSPWHWLAHNVNSEGVLVPVRRDLTPNDTATVRAKIDAERGDYRLEVWQLSSKDRPGRRDGLIYDVRGGDVLEWCFDVSATDGTTDEQVPEILRFVLFRREDVPNYERPKWIDHPTEYDRTEYYAQALTTSFLHLFQDTNAPVIEAGIPEGIAVHPQPDASWTRPYPEMRLFVHERFPWQVSVQGRVVPVLELPRELEARDGDRVSEEVGKKRHEISVPWPSGEDGDRSIEVKVIDAFGRSTRRTFHYVYDTVAPQLKESPDGPLSARSDGVLELEATERLLQATFVDAAGTHHRLEVRGSVLTVDVSRLPRESREGTLVLRDPAGNEARIDVRFENP